MGRLIKDLQWINKVSDIEELPKYWRNTDDYWSWGDDEVPLQGSRRESGNPSGVSLYRPVAQLNDKPGDVRWIGQKKFIFCADQVWRSEQDLLTRQRKDEDAQAKSSKTQLKKAYRLGYKHCGLWYINGKKVGIPEGMWGAADKCDAYYNGWGARRVELEKAGYNVKTSYVNPVKP